MRGDKIFSFPFIQIIASIKLNDKYLGWEICAYESVLLLTEFLKRIAFSDVSLRVKQHESETGF